MLIQGSDRTLARHLHGALVASLALSMLGLIASNNSLPAKPKPPQPITAPAQLSFSSAPADAEFLRTGLFAEPLAPIVQGDREDNRDLAQALLAYQSEVEQSGAPDAVAPIVRYLDSHPDSPWR